jgi:hypothetical protein
VPLVVSTNRSNVLRDCCLLLRLDPLAPLTGVCSFVPRLSGGWEGDLEVKTRLDLWQKSENTLKPSASIGVASARYLRLLYDSKIFARGLIIEGFSLKLTPMGIAVSDDCPIVAG